MQINLNSIIWRRDDLVFHDLPDMTVMLSVEKERYYGFEEVGTRIWQLIEKPTQLEQVCRQLLDEFNVDRETCETETLAFVRRLREEDLVNSTNEPIPADSAHSEA